MRNVAKNIEVAKKIATKDQRFDIGSDELKELMSGQIKDSTIDGLYHAVVNAYYFGLAVGSRMKNPKPEPMIDEDIRKQINDLIEWTDDEDVPKLILGILARIA